jgi:hypothetical protein
MKDKDVVAGSVLMIFSIIGFFLSSALPEASVGLSPGFYPSFLCVSLFLCGFGIAFQGWKRSTKISIPKFNWKKLIPIVVLILLYSNILEYLHFRLSTILFMIVAMYILGLRSPLKLGSISIISTMVIYYLFVYVFKTPIV